MPTPTIVDRAAFEAEIAGLRAREKAHTREGDAIASARRALPMVEVDAGLELVGPDGAVTLLDAFEGRRQLRVFETYWTTRRGVEAMDYSLALMDLTAYGRQEPWEHSPAGWPQNWTVDGSNTRIDGRPIAQWSRLHAGRSDGLDG